MKSDKKKKRKKREELFKKLNKLRKERLFLALEKIEMESKVLNPGPGKRLVYTPHYYQEELNELKEEIEKKQNERHETRATLMAL